MAVYTNLGAGDLAALLRHYDVGELVSAKGIAEGVSNSNWLIETTKARYILTMYERRTRIADLPFFLGLLDHLSAAGCPVPRTIHDRDGAPYRLVDGKAVALIEFLPGISVDRPTPEQARGVGGALANLHRAAASFPQSRENALAPPACAAMLDRFGRDELATIDADLPAWLDNAGEQVRGAWPVDLPRGIVHADLFPDNVLLRGDRVTGLIDFYFACTDMLAYDLAVTHAAWCFADGGRRFDAAVSGALLEGYRAVRPLDDAELAAIPMLAQGAALRFVATRVADWIDTPADALVTRKDPMDFVRRAQFYEARGMELFA